MSDFKPIFDHFWEKMTFLSCGNEKSKACIQALIFTHWVKRMQLNDRMLKC
jgi:hypothetical protein